MFLSVFAKTFAALAVAALGVAQTLKWDQTFMAGVNVGAQASSARTDFVPAKMHYDFSDFLRSSNMQKVSS